MQEIRASRSVEQMEEVKMNFSAEVWVSTGSGHRFATRVAGQHRLVVGGCLDGEEIDFSAVAREVQGEATRASRHDNEKSLREALDHEEFEALEESSGGDELH
mmetsp:Transcript_48822/g.157610  ORF Transcript_48822/g.157610 Transcript_48822/m.157610 type:complete len:103 (+) Transcript_48822:1795-2103(+)